MFAKTFRDEKRERCFPPSPLPLHLSVAFFPGCSDSQPHPRASDNTVLNGRGQTRSRSPRYFATFQAFNLARVPLLAIVPMIVGWESLSPLRVFFFFFPLPPFLPGNAPTHPSASLSLSLSLSLFLSLFIYLFI